MPIPASYMTSSAPSLSDSFSPHTSSGAASVITAVKASVGSPFFHAHLQEGRRIEEGSDVASAGSSTGGSGARSWPGGTSGSGSSHGVSPLNTNIPRNAGASTERKLRDTFEGGPHGSRARASPQSTEKPARGASARIAVPSAKNQLHLQDAFMSRSAGSSPARTTAYPIGVDEQDVWMAAASAQAAAAAGVNLPPSKRYHYITRSQSLDAGIQQQAPKMRKQNASYNAAYNAQQSQTYPFAPGPPMRIGGEELRMPDAHANPWATSPPVVRGRHLSPIEETTSYFGEKHGDTASLRSNASTQTNLFIHRSVRRTPSTSTMNSSHSAGMRGGYSEDQSTRGYHGRALGEPLPVIPASPRESQNVFEADHSMMPGIFPHEAQLEYSGAYPIPISEQDLGETGYAVLNGKKPHTHTRFALTRGIYTENDDSSLEEQDLGALIQASRVAAGPRASSPSLLSRSDSVRTELTYITAQDSSPGSRRASAAADLEGGRRRSRLANVINADENSNGVAGRAVARMKASFDTLLSRKLKTPPPGPTQAASLRPSITQHAQARPKSENGTSTKTIRSLASPAWVMHARSQIAETFKGKPAEMLFWTGFLAPWCWLIGGWMLSRDTGDTRPPEPPTILGTQTPTNASRSNLRSEQQQTDKQRGKQVSMWDAARGSSAELLTAVRGERAHVPDEEKGETEESTEDMRHHGGVYGSSEKRVARIGDALQESASLDPWVARCRVAAILAGMLLLALCIVALIVLVRSL